MALALALRGRMPPLAELPPGMSSWLFLGDGAAARIELERSISGRLERISTAGSLQRHAGALRRPYIDAIGRLSLLNDAPEWWASELAAKNSFTRLFDRLCALAVARELIGSGLDDCLVICATPSLLSEVESAAATAGTETVRVGNQTRVAKPRARAVVASRLIDRLGPRVPLPVMNRAARVGPWVERSHTFRRRVLRSLDATSEPLSGPATALLLTWVDERNVTPEGSYVDPHLGSLPEAMRRRGYQLAFLPRFLPGAGFTDLARRLIGTGERFLFPELLLYDATLRRCEATAREFSPAIPETSDVSGVPFARLAQEHVEEFRVAQARSLTYEPLVEQLAREGVEPELLVHTFEGHAWEQVLADAVRRHLPGTRMIGFDNLQLSRFALSRYPAAAELGLRPLPDRIVTNGPISRDDLLAEGLPERVVVAGCAIRHAHLYEPRGGATAPVPECPVVLVATGGASFDQAVDLIVKAVDAFGSGEDWQLVVKCHPLIPTQAVEPFVRDATGVGGIYTDRSVSELLSSASLLLYTYNSVCHDALAAGVPPVFVQAETDVDIDQLEAFPDVRWTGRTAAELQAAARAILELSPAELAAWRGRARGVVRAILTPPTPDCVEAFVG